MSANERQIGGDHYGGGDYQYWDFASDLKFPYLVGCAGKYVFRWHRKGRELEDLDKALHFLDKIIEVDTQPMPVMNRPEKFWRLVISNKMNVMDGAALYYIMEGEWVVARELVATMRAELSPSDTV